MVLMMFASPLQMHLMTALTANPSEHNPCNIGRENPATSAIMGSEICRRTAEVFARPEFQDRVAKDIMIPVEGVKAKIGNVVTNIGLLGRKKGRQGSGLFGV